jgi:ABC-type amino acid transport substrate-binding protein
VKRAGALLLACLAVQAVSAQSQASDNLASRLDVAQQVGRCTVRLAPETASAFVLGTPGERGTRALAWTRLRPQAMNCIGARHSSVTMRDIDYVGAIAEALLERDGTVLARARALPAATPVRLTGQGDAEQLFGCAVAARPTDASAIVVAEPGSEQEAAAFRALVPALQACMPASGAIKFKPFQVRLLTATALYRQAASAAAGA